MSALKTWFENLSLRLFENLKSSEVLTMGLEGETSHFVRWNRSQIRQNTTVEQYLVELSFSFSNRKMSRSVMLTKNLEVDIKTCLSILENCRKEFSLLPEDPHFTPPSNGGVSDQVLETQLPKIEDLISETAAQFADVDMAGLLTSGWVYRASYNSLGQRHWFAAPSTFMDYSLFTVSASQTPKAVKGVYYAQDWNSLDYQRTTKDSINQMQHLKKKEVKVSPGQYRTFLTPSAVAQLGGMFSWNALSYSAFREGKCAFRHLGNKETTLSSKFTLKENFGLGLTPRFNSEGEVAPQELMLIENGQLKNWLVSSRAAQEYKVPSNGAATSSWGSTYLRSPEILPGNLSLQNSLKDLDKGLHLSYLHYLNWSDIQTARITGMTRYASFWVEQGEIVGPIADLRFDVSLYDILGADLQGLTQESFVDPAVDTYFQRGIGGIKTPGALIDRFHFTL